MLKKILFNLQCPISHNNLTITDNNTLSSGSKNYQIQNGIIDFVQSEEKVLPDNYMAVQEEKYNRWATSRFIMKLVWGVDLNKIPKIADEFNNIPEGPIVDLPCGTGVFGTNIYKAYPERVFIAIDYSMNMIKFAKKRCDNLGIKNVVFVRADVSKLPIKNEQVAGCLSLNGFHSFPDPRKAAFEICRTTKINGKLLMSVSCFKERLISDLFIKYMMIPKGYLVNALSNTQYASFLKEAGYSKVDYQMLGASMLARCVR